MLLDPESFELIRQVSVGATSDSAGLVLGDTFYFGTVNAPDASCQDPIDPACGALFGLDPDGDVVQRRDYAQGFRAWIGTGVTTDGTALYFGSAAQTVGEKSGDETTYLYGCSVIRTDPALNVEAAFDPGELACHELPYQGANMDSVSGEVSPDGNGLWAQYVRPNGTEMETALYRLNAALNEVCRVTFPFEPQTQAIGFYGAPTVDREGRAYVAVTVPDSEQGRSARLYRVEPQTCQATLLVERKGVWAQASPTLADDRYVLFATDGRLDIHTLDGAPVSQYALASEARVLAAPVIHDGVVYVLQEDATLNVIDQAGVRGYGEALWPRYRHDNAASARLEGSAPVPAQNPGPDGAFIVVHLEVSTLPRVRALWPLLRDAVSLADRYGHRLTLHFSAQWAQMAQADGLVDEIRAWEAAGHEIGLHHHGPSHTFFDGYTNRPDLIGATDYAFDFGHQGDMTWLMEIVQAVAAQPIRSASMSDADIDWPAGVPYYATDSGDSPSPEDLVSSPVSTVHNGQTVTEIYNAGYAIDHLGDAAVDLADVEQAFSRAGAGEYLGLVINDNTLEAHYDQIEPLFQLLADHGVITRGVSALLDARVTGEAP